ncbi:hypothetical protein Tco_0223249 [Tanacetum coccineum]
MDSHKSLQAFSCVPQQIPGVRKCNKFVWYDPELDCSWYRNHLYHMYGQLHPHQMQDIDTEIRSQELLMILQDDFASLQDDHRQSQKNASFWKKMFVGRNDNWNMLKVRGAHCIAYICTDNTDNQRTKKTYHITFNESLKAIKFTKPLVDNINIAESERYPPDEYLHPYEPSQVSSDQNGQADQNDHNYQNDQPAQTDEILNDDQPEHSNHTNDEQIVDNLPSTKDIQISEHLSSPKVEDTSVHDTIPILNPSLSIPSMVSPAPQDSWSQDNHIELVNIIGDPETVISRESLEPRLKKLMLDFSS